VELVLLDYVFGYPTHPGSMADVGNVGINHATGKMGFPTAFFAGRHVQKRPFCARAPRSPSLGLAPYFGQGSTAATILNILPRIPKGET
jgi:hypothetical protein